MEREPLTEFDIAYAYYVNERRITASKQTTYERIVDADLTISALVEDLKLTIEQDLANIPTQDGEDVFSEAKIKRIVRKTDILEKNLLGKCERLYSTIKSREFELSK